MLKYSYKCDDCEHECTQMHERGEAPRVQECPECGGTLRRVIRVNSSADISQGDDAMNEKSNKIRKNLKHRRKRVAKMDPTQRERFEQWSKRQTGGRW